LDRIATAAILCFATAAFLKSHRLSGAKGAAAHSETSTIHRRPKRSKTGIIKQDRQCTYWVAFV